MPSNALTNRRIAIFEDNSLNRERLSDMVNRCGAIALPVEGPTPKLNHLKAYFSAQQISMVVCDHHLSQQNDYAPFSGAEAVAKCYSLGIAGVLVTAFEKEDAEASLRRFRRHIPALVRSPLDSGRKSIEAALLLADQEVRENKPPRERIPHRTIMTVSSLHSRGDSKVVKVMMSQWDATQEVGFPLDLVPKKLQAAVKPGAFLIAEVNIDAERQEELYFDKFELPDADVLKNAKSLFIRP